MSDPKDTARLQYAAEHPEVMRFLYDMLGEIWVNDKTGKVSQGLLKTGSTPLEGIRALLDDEMEERPNG